MSALTAGRNTPNLLDFGRSVKESQGLFWLSYPKPLKVSGLTPYNELIWHMNTLSVFRSKRRFQG